MRTVIVEYLQAVRSVFGKTAPYILIELLLPGGTLIALLLFLYRRKRGGAGAAPSAQPPFTMFMRIRDEVATVSSATAWRLRPRHRTASRRSLPCPAGDRSAAI